MDLTAGAPNPSSSPKKVHSGGTDRVHVERVVTTPGTSTAQEDSDNITKTLTMATHSEDVSFETLFTERNPRCQENQGDVDAEVRPKAPSSSKDSTTMDEDGLKLHNMELTARVAMLEAEVSKLRHQVSMHEAHQCPTVPTPCLVLVGTQTDAALYTDATKGEIVAVEDDVDSLEEWIQEAVDEVLKDESQNEDTPPLLEFDSILAWGYDDSTERFWIRKEFSGVEELNWNALNPLQVLELYLSNCINTSTDLSAELAISRFQDLMEENLPWFETLLEEANRVAYPKDNAESSTVAKQRLASRRLDVIRSSTLTEEEVVCWRRSLYNKVVRDVEVLGWSSTGSSDFTFFLSNGSSLSININEILLLNSDFLHKLEKEGLLAMDASDSDSDLSFLSSPTVKLNTEEESKRREEEKVKEGWKEVTAEIPTASATSVVVVHEAEAEAFSKDKGKGLMTKEDEERVVKEKKEKEERRRREEEEMAEL
ncbi:hypothetical protein L1987_06618 [Smallanthus sonchifolius]|uniref:Uncharacterized protein n=1 Tax=Smallanthus sonchifolius TaxID=185202 RepID=A0ACB9JYQ8_9ASTR|nr:hypothetical protein L1987_06618 [Smallanthus sonchifolius]